MRRMGAACIVAVWSASTGSATDLVTKAPSHPEVVCDIDKTCTVRDDVKRGPTLGLGLVFRRPLATKQADLLKFRAHTQQWRQFSENIRLTIRHLPTTDDGPYSLGAGNGHSLHR
jgi:hypothetical protein